METRHCQNCKNSFNIEPDDFSFYEKMKVPPPTFCSQCRLVRRLARRNERTFHSQVCKKCNKKIIAINTEKKIFPEVVFQKRMEEALNKPFIYSKTTQLVVFELKQKFPNEFKLVSTKSLFKKLIKF